MDLVRIGMDSTSQPSPAVRARELNPGCCARPGIEPGLTSRLRVQIRIVPPAETEKTRDKCADPPGAKTASPKSKVRARRRGTLF